MLKALILQEKGGVGKSYFAKILSLYMLKKEQPFHMFDCDNASQTMYKYAQHILKLLEKEDSTDTIVPQILKWDFNSGNNKIDRSKFDNFLETIYSIKHSVIADFGAATSEQLLYYILESPGIVEDFKEMGITIFMVVSGGSAWPDCYSFLLKAGKADILSMITVVANEHTGGVGEKSVTDLLLELNVKPIELGTIADITDEAYIGWQEKMTTGITWKEIKNLNITARRRHINYLNPIFEQIEKLEK